MTPPIPLTPTQNRELHGLTEQPAFAALNALLDALAHKKECAMIESDGGSEFQRLQIERNTIRELSQILALYSVKPEEPD